MRYWVVFTAIVCACVSAQAQEPFPDADIVCSRTQDAALVRFPTNSPAEGPAASVYAALPGSADGGLSGSKGQNRTDCRMHNGWVMRIRTGSGQAFAYGIGGADPPGFFSLWIEKRKVLSRYEWKPGYDNSGPMLVGFIIKPTSLTYCTQDYGEPDGPITCKNKPFELGKFKADAVEYPAKPGRKMPPGTAYVVRAPAGRQFCEGELVAARAFMQEDISASVPGGFKPEDPKGFDRRAGMLDLDKSLPGIVGKRVVSLSSNTHYFDGDVIIIAPAATPTSEISKRFPVDDVEKEVAQTLPPGWTVIAGGQKAFYTDVSPRYVHFDAQNIDGNIYFLARPTNFTKHPAATLVKPLATGGYEISCTFNAVELNY